MPSVTTARAVRSYHPMLTIEQRIVRAADRTDHSVTFMSGDEGERVPWSTLHADARVMAAGLQAAGVEPGGHVAILGPTTRDLVTTIEATWLAGATVVVLPLPMRMSSIDEFVAQTRRRIYGADIDLLVVDPDLAPFVEARPEDPPALGYAELRTAGEGRRPSTVGADLERLAILQFTSGSTADPKGVMLPHRSVASNLDAMIERARFDPDVDVMVSWLPLYHDMGLVGILTVAMTTGCELVLGAPQDFMASPARWVRWMSEHRGTITAGPNFAYVLAARALNRLEGLDLSSLRLALNGAEPVNPDTVDRFLDAGARHGLRRGAIFPAFGMAELSIGGTFPHPMTGLRTDDVDLRVLETDRYAAPADPAADGTRRLVKLGTALPGLELRIVDPDDGRRLVDREVGELQIRGTSLMTGYYRRPDVTAACSDDGWLRTGDLAYLVDGELVICGRIKDVIIVAGRNVFPEDIEQAAATVEGIRAGNVIAFGVDSRRADVQSVVVVAETRSTTDEHDGMRRAVASRVRGSAGIAAGEVVLVAPGSLPKTSSGKLQRALCKQRWGTQDLQPAG